MYKINSEKLKPHNQNTYRAQWQKKAFFLEGRHRVIRALRDYFYSENFLEVTTPALQVSPGMEPHLRAFRTELELPSSRKVERYLQTSPEFAMKKLLASGLERIFQIAPCYRNRERSETHHPEFSMLEWYRVGRNYQDLMADCESLLKSCKAAVGPGLKVTFRQVECDLGLPFERITVCEAFQRYANIDLLDSIDCDLAPGPGGLSRHCERLGIYWSKDDTWEDLFFRISLEKIEPMLGQGRATFLYDYPVSMAALSRPKSDNSRLAERFELYVCGLELANAFGELTDAKLQRERFEADQKKKLALYGEIYPIDEDFLRALEEGMPECSGIALGVDRLVMLCTGADSIEQVLWIEVDEKSRLP